MLFLCIALVPVPRTHFPVVRKYSEVSKHTFKLLTTKITARLMKRCIFATTA